MLIHESHLAGRDLRLARYLAALSAYREAAARFAVELTTGSADMSECDAANTALAAAEEAALHDLMLPLADAAAALGYSHQHMARLCRDHGPNGSQQVRCEKRHGKLWYLFVPDVEYLIASGEIPGPYKK